MTTEQKKQAIIAAIKAGDVSRNELNPASRGKYAGKLVKGGNVGDDKINEMYENLQRCQAGNKAQAPKAATKPAKPARAHETDSRLAKLEAENSRLIEENSELKQAIKDLADRLDNLERIDNGVDNKVDNRLDKVDNEVDNEVDNKASAMSVLGFTLQQRTTGGNGRYWYGGRRFAGKLQWIYIGKDVSRAEAKIQRWLDAHAHAIGTETE